MIILKLVYSIALTWDDPGYLHVGFHDEYTILEPISNRSLYTLMKCKPSNDMAQHWFIYEGTDDEVPSLSFHLIA